jgi:uncharacterized membrane protein
MVEFRTSARIDAPLDRVWQTLIDVERWPEWTASMRRVERLDAGPLSVGSRVRIKQPRLPAVVWQVTSLDPRQSFGWTARSIGITSVADHQLSTSTDGAVTVTLVLRQTGPLGWLVGTLAGRMTRRYLNLEAQGLKSRSELIRP